MIVKRPIAFLLFLTCGFVAASANDSPTKAEFEALVARVEKLESILASLENSARIEAKQGSVSPASLNSGESKDTLLDNFIRVIHNREDNINYPMDGS